MVGPSLLREVATVAILHHNAEVFFGDEVLVILHDAGGTQMGQDIDLHPGLFLVLQIYGGGQHQLAMYV